MSDTPNWSPLRSDTVIPTAPGDDVSSHADTIRVVLDWPIAYYNEEQEQMARKALVALLAENERLREALERISEEQPQVLAKLEQNGIVFDDLGADPKNWQHVAFTIYNHLCSVDLAAREALAGDTE